MMYLMRWVIRISQLWVTNIFDKINIVSQQGHKMCYYTILHHSQFLFPTNLEPRRRWEIRTMTCINKAKIDPAVAWSRAPCWDVRNGDYEHQFHVISSPTDTVIVAPGWLIHAFNVRFRSWKEFKLATWNKCVCNAPPGFFTLYYEHA